jgi:hypothetical protein
MRLDSTTEESSFEDDEYNLIVMVELCDEGTTGRGGV